MWSAPIVTNKEAMKEKSMITDEDFLKDFESLDIQKFTLRYQSQILWTLAHRTSEEDKEGFYAKEDSRVSESLQMVAGLEPHHPAYSYYLQIFNSFANKHSIPFSKILRMKLNLLPRGGINDVGKYHTPHIDYDKEHKVFLYYINDSDGDTIFFEETYNGKEILEFTEMDRISPKRGKGIVFSGERYHASSSPIQNSYRIVLNIDFI